MSSRSSTNDEKSTTTDADSIRTDVKLESPTRAMPGAAVGDKSAPLPLTLDVNQSSTSFTPLRSPHRSQPDIFIGAPTPRYLSAVGAAPRSPAQRREDAASAASLPLSTPLIQPYSRSAYMRGASATLSDSSDGASVSVCATLAQTTPTNITPCAAARLVAHDPRVVQPFSRTFRDKSELQLRSECRAGMLHQRSMLHDTEAALELARDHFFTTQTVLLEQFMHMVAHDAEYSEAFRDRAATLAELAEKKAAYHNEYREFLHALVQHHTESTTSREQTLRTMTSMLQQTAAALAQTCLEQHSHNNERVREEREQMVGEIVQLYEAFRALGQRRDRIHRSIARLRRVIAEEEGELRCIRGRYAALQKEVQTRASSKPTAPTWSGTTTATAAQECMAVSAGDDVDEMIAARRDFDLVSAELAEVQDALVRAQTYHAVQLRGQIVQGEQQKQQASWRAQLGPEAAAEVRRTVRHALELVNEVLSCAQQGCAAGEDGQPLGGVLAVHTLKEHQTIQNFIVRKVNKILPHLLHRKEIATEGAQP